MQNKTRLALLLLILTSGACQLLSPPAPADDAILDGPVDGLTHEQALQFVRGDVAFNDRVFTPETGLGPVFVATSCGSCHAGDGKGHPSTTLLRFGQSDTLGNTWLHLGGPQLQHRAIPGFQPEQLPADAPFTRITPPANTGLGFLELVSDNDILAMADENTHNPDGIRGHPNWIRLPGYLTPPPGAVSQNRKYIARFGKKGAAYNLLHQTVNAYNQDIGITSVFDPYDVYSHQETDPEITTQEIRDVVFYLQTLKAPVQRNADHPEVQRGLEIFKTIGCETCHRQTLRTGYSPVDALSNKAFHPYTDLLVHDLGPGLDDGYTEGSAATGEWRTPPLWGLGLAPNSQGGTWYLLHDGRARTIEQAIEMHGGEAALVRDRYLNLSSGDRDALLRFLKSL